MIILSSTTQINYPRGKEKVTNKQSLTVPDMSYTIREILDKFTTMPQDLLQEANYSENPEFADAIQYDVDLTDITANQQDIENLTAQLTETKNKFLKEQKLKNQQKAEAEKKELEYLRKLKKAQDKNVSDKLTE